MNLLVPVAVDGLIVAANMVFVVLACSLSIALGRFVNFAHALEILLCPYCYLMFSQFAGLPRFASLALALAVTVGISNLWQLFIFMPLQAKNAGTGALTLGSLGLYIAGQSVIGLYFGPELYSVSGPVGHSLKIEYGSISLTPVDLVIVVAGAVIAAAFAIIIPGTAFGLRLRAIADDPLLAQLRGLDVRPVLVGGLSLSSALMGLAGMGWAIEYQLRPSMGLSPFLFGAITAVLTGPLRRPAAAIIVTVLLTQVQQLLIWQLGTRWQDFLFYAFVVAVLLIRPTGVDKVSARSL